MLVTYSMLSDEIASYLIEQRKQCALLALEAHWKVGNTVIEAGDISVPKLYGMVMLEGLTHYSRRKFDFDIAMARQFSLDELMAMGKSLTELHKEAGL